MGRGEGSREVWGFFAGRCRGGYRGMLKIMVSFEFVNASSQESEKFHVSQDL